MCSALWLHYLECVQLFYRLRMFGAVCAVYMCNNDRQYKSEQVNTYLYERDWRKKRKFGSLCLVSHVIEVFFINFISFTDFILFRFTVALIQGHISLLSNTS